MADKAGKRNKGRRYSPRVQFVVDWLAISVAFCVLLPALALIGGGLFKTDDFFEPFKWVASLFPADFLKADPGQPQKARGAVAVLIVSVLVALPTAFLYGRIRYAGSKAA